MKRALVIANRVAAAFEARAIAANHLLLAALIEMSESTPKFFTELKINPDELIRELTDGRRIPRDVHETKRNSAAVERHLGEAERLSKTLGAKETAVEALVMTLLRPEIRGGTFLRAHGISEDGLMTAVIGKTTELSLTLPQRKSSGPDLMIVWNPELVSAEDYARLVVVLGDIVRAAGGAGVRRIDSNTAMVHVGRPVLV